MTWKFTFEAFILRLSRESRKTHLRQSSNNTNTQVLHFNNSTFTKFGQFVLLETCQHSIPILVASFEGRESLLCIWTNRVFNRRNFHIPVQMTFNSSIEHKAMPACKINQVRFCFKLFVQSVITLSVVVELNICFAYYTAC